MSKFLRDLENWAARDGWTAAYTGSGHIRWTHPRVARPVFTPKTPTVRDGGIERAKLRRALREVADADG